MLPRAQFGACHLNLCRSTTVYRLLYAQYTCLLMCFGRCISSENGNLLGLHSPPIRNSLAATHPTLRAIDVAMPRVSHHFDPVEWRDVDFMEPEPEPEEEPV
jgi:hypothetical protein